jgi:hypothetical protein
MTNTRLDKLLALIVFILLFGLYGCKSKDHKPTNEVLQRGELPNTLPIVPTMTVTPARFYRSHLPWPQ